MGHLFDVAFILVPATLLVGAYWTVLKNKVKGGLMVRNKLSAIAVVVISSLAPVLKAENGSAGCQAVQIPQEIFDAAGLSKLSESELRTLQCWALSLEPRAAAPEFEARADAGEIRVPSDAPEADEDVSELEVSKKEEGQLSTGGSGGFSEFRKSVAGMLSTASADSYSAKIVGSFTGWTGRTRFKLNNGEEWIQRKDGFLSADLDSPDVEIRVGRFGFATLWVPELRRGIQVKRAK